MSAIAMDMYRIRRTVSEMLKDRGYVIPQDPEYEEEVDDLEVFNEVFHTAQGDAVCVVYCDGNIGIDKIKRIKNKHTIMVYSGNVTSSARSAIGMMYLSEGARVETFSFSELRNNKTKHTLVPKHELLSESEARDFFKRYGMPANPKIKTTDAIAKYYGAQAKDVFKITRRSGEITYRVVI
uniref:RNA polymerase subunit H/Rpb5 C-terminal domain-containing protein n=1 Tax=viral metagenome TaxID=1070528 RepID=A0A6C0M207_9ZZZZ